VSIPPRVPATFGANFESVAVFDAGGCPHDNKNNENETNSAILRSDVNIDIKLVSDAKLSQEQREE
jgi:hypothetical protein